ncbi:MAG: S8 family serine peptidase [Thalassospira sp.]|uniref:S8 family serine peptidase n=1 Tax=Thalassospira sp. TaxID=1912094 RepID=UPI001B0179A4|nr:S8 family serine peptidase [Thalassospira sp.]MBO6577545.1 S8 family serine peptidase [Thalassospira sp.]MBO6818070.1 S8 family serine peptidase [Thalassospira sp.]MBO6886705.1 S8 family serine peptidase [Thalassospira sp.]
MVGERPVLKNPALRLLVSAKTSKSENNGSSAMNEARKTRVSRHQKHLISNLQDLIEYYADLPSFAGKTIIWLRLHSDAAAPSHTPINILTTIDCTNLAPWRGGYLIEIDLPGLKKLLDRVKKPPKSILADISNILGAESFPEALKNEFNARAQALDAMDRDPDGYRWFLLSLAPYKNAESRNEIEQNFTRLASRLASSSRLLAAPDEISADVVSQEADGVSFETSLQALSFETAGSDPKRVVVGVKSTEELEKLILSGSIGRWEAISQPIGVSPGIGQEPDTPLPDIDNAPIVGVIDGGYHRNLYQYAVAWNEEKLVSDFDADTRHGNVITALVVDAAGWSSNLDIPNLPCRVGVVQAVPARGKLVSPPLTPNRIARYLAQAMARHPDTLVWNFSANIDRECDPFDVSELAHSLRQVARHFDRLLVISSGNKTGKDPERIAPPADCDSALVVAGRSHDMFGHVDGICPVSRNGFGPEVMFKPDLSWFSRQRILGGSEETGSSFSAPLVSRLAAHCFANLADPTPDLVRGLLLNAADLPAGKFCKHRGYGSPVRLPEPWNCPENTVILSWKADMLSGTEYLWPNIAIPPSMLNKNGKLAGRLRLIAIMDPTIQRLGDEYFSCRAEVSIGWRDAESNEWKSLLGVSKPETYEHIARKDEQKWQPVQFFEKKFTRKNVDVEQLSVKAQIYWRHKFMYNPEILQLREHPVTFVLSFESIDSRADTYNQFVQLMGTNVENLTTEINVEVQ